ncbi:MAG TPA: leucyl/phenylalanyl-tRNA--protein transferase [Methylomirabilota bacterium]|nr:leucyl/phenylalanyl-tRNA--protein transferase [Methylomirabilota bacterium]
MSGRRARPAGGGPRTPVPLPPSRWRFPDPRAADAEGLVAHGGDLEPATLVDAYRRGIFPWPADARALLWWSPDPRAVLPVEGPRVSRRLARTLRQGRFRVTLDADFAAVVAGCADRPQTWLTPAMCEAYVRLHRLGWAHSVEVWTADGALAGGLYGVAVGGLFAAESMFHRARDASKVALVALAAHARRVGTALIDVQMPTPHLASLGAVTVSRAEYLKRLAGALARPVDFAAAAPPAAGPNAPAAEAVPPDGGVA